LKRATLALVVMVVATVLAAGTAMAVVDDAQRSSAGRDATLDRALEELVSRRGGPPGAIAVMQRDERRKIHAAGVADLSKGRPIGLNNRMRVASTSQAFSGAVALWLPRARSP
jgi:D-alanyl-D-alanine carboxypeptidase